MGNTPSLFAGSCVYPVHPHVRGEYGKFCGFLSDCLGSSPRAWGIRRSPQTHGSRTRFIPTCVGNTVRGEGSMPSSWVHPHVRGEYFNGVCLIAGQTGSSPRAWGIPDNIRAGREPARFIPTCVGNTYKGEILITDIAVHPHVRGEYHWDYANKDCPCGSSPRAWGIRVLVGKIQASNRFIPTCVGNTYTRPACKRRCPVHPHVRGEYCQCKSVRILENGSSPRAWGILCF